MYEGVSLSTKSSRVSVVIPTKDRPALLRRCLRAVLDQESEVAFEVIVVNDAGCSVDCILDGDGRVSLVEGPGRGPAAARNAGIAGALGDVVLFTDDDAIPQPGWIQAAITSLAGTPAAVGVVGRVESPSFDPLYEHSVRNDGGVGNFLTCNAAYRRSALATLGGFDEDFPYPAAEDRDLGYRMQSLGEVLFEPQMVVIHPPRPTRLWDEILRGGFLQSEWLLHLKHPETRPPRWAARWGPFIRLVRHWQRLLTADRVVGGSVRRAVRFAAMAIGQLGTGLWVTLLDPHGQFGGAPGTVANDAPDGVLRLAWIGPAPRPGGGAAGCAWLVVQGLANRGCEVDCFLTDDPDDLPPALFKFKGVRVVNVDTGWRYDRWYSRGPMTKVLTGFAARAWGRRRLGSLIIQQHGIRPYDVLYQFSTIELFGLRSRLSKLPPLVLHPSTHAAGELRGMRAERHLSARCEPIWRRMIVEALLAFRTACQRRDIRLAAKVLAISRRFADHLIADYGVDPDCVSVVPNPIDLDALQAVDRPSQERHIAFISRMSVRKSVEVIIELSHRLADLEGGLVLDLAGAETLWSDYRPLLDDLHSGIARSHGYLHRPELMSLLAEADVLVQPASFEPFGLTVGEALACGVPVVASNEVGAAEDVSSECCILVPPGDAGALNNAIREMLDRLDGAEGPEVRRRARAEAERLFAPDHVAALALQALSAVAEGRRVGAQ